MRRLLRAVRKYLRQRHSAMHARPRRDRYDYTPPCLTATIAVAICEAP